MAHLDGEQTTMSRDAMDAHLASCAICRSVADDLRGVTRATQAWSIDAAPSTLRAPDASRGRLLIPRIPAWTRSRAAIVALGAAAAVLIVVASTTQPRTVRSVIARPIDVRPETMPFEAGQAGPQPVAPPSAGAAGGRVSSRAATLNAVDDVSAAQGQIARGPMVIRTALVRIVVKEFGPVREAVEAIVSQTGGFIDAMTVDANSATARSLRGSLRVPSDRLGDVLARLRALGQVTEDTQGSQDVTDQIVDLDARLASARATEQRLTELLKNRTGRLSDVLDVERELARVRLDIERLDAQKTNLARRVTYATIDIHIAEERKAGIDTGPLSLMTRIRVAAADGAEAAIESVVGTVLFVLRAGPVLLLWGAAAAAAWIMLRRAKVFRPRASE